jgi:hypothetical protein
MGRLNYPKIKYKTQDRPIIRYLITTYQWYMTERPNEMGCGAKQQD